VRGIVTSRENPIPDSCQIDLDILGANLNQYDFEPTLSRLEHHSQVVLPSEGGLNSEAFSLPRMFACRFQDFPCASNRKSATAADCSVLPIVSGSSTGTSQNSSEFQRLRIVLPEHAGRGSPPRLDPGDRRRKTAATTLPYPALFCEAVVKEIAVMTLVISGV